MSLPAGVAAPLHKTQAQWQAWRTTAGRLLALGGQSQGNELVLFTNGDDAFTAMLRAIESARVRVWLEVYIFEPDPLGLRVLEALTAAARRGVEVKLLVDALGSQDLKDIHLAPLRAAGGGVAIFNPLRFRRGPGRALPFLLRDHRKILIIDDNHGFCGGMNVAVDYAGPTMGNNRFRDTHLLLSGPGVVHLADVFANGWEHATNERPTLWHPGPPKHEGSHLQILGSDRFLGRRRIQRALHTAISRSERTAYLTTPYFVPPPKLLRALRHAARRGVDVQVLTAGISDVPIAAAAARHLYGTLLEDGVKIFELGTQTLHAKTAVVDGLYAHVGSFNLDPWSFERNLEVCAMTLDPGFAEALEAVFANDLLQSEEVTADAWRRRTTWQRFKGFVAWHIARL